MYLFLVLIILWLLFERYRYRKAFHSLHEHLHDPGGDADLRADNTGDTVAEQESRFENEEDESPIGMPELDIGNQTTSTLLVVLVLAVAIACVLVLVFVFYPTWLVG